MSTSTKTLPSVADVMLVAGNFPQLAERALLKEALDGMSRHHLGIACICDQEQRLLGIVTDGDIRRKLLTVQKPLSALFVDDALNHAITSPVTVSVQSSLRDAIDLMEQHKIWDLPVLGDNAKLVGMLHLHPAVQALLDHSGS